MNDRIVRSIVFPLLLMVSSTMHSSSLVSAITQGGIKNKLLAGTAALALVLIGVAYKNSIAFFGQPFLSRENTQPRNTKLQTKTDFDRIEKRSQLLIDILKDNHYIRTICKSNIEECEVVLCSTRIEGCSLDIDQINRSFRSSIRGYQLSDTSYPCAFQKEALSAIIESVKDDMSDCLKYEDSNGKTLLCYTIDRLRNAFGDDPAVHFYKLFYQYSDLNPSYVITENGATSFQGTLEQYIAKIKKEVQCGFLWFSSPGCYGKCWHERNLGFLNTMQALIKNRSSRVQGVEQECKKFLPPVLSSLVASYDE